MPTTRHLGNDIVALTSPRCRGKIDDQRFLQRILTPEDEAFIFSTPDPEIALWISWAGKEALFKSATKALGSPPVFEHRKFRVDFSSEDLRGRRWPFTLAGTATYERISVQLEAEVHQRFIHVVAWQDPNPRDRPRNGQPQRATSSWETDGERAEKELSRLFSPWELECISHPASAHTRLAARSTLAEVLGVEEERLEIRCGEGGPGRRVPLVFLDGREAPVDLSISHDAHLMAWAWDVLGP